MPGIAATSVSAVVVTRGDVDLTEIGDSILDAGIEDLIVWENGKTIRRYGAVEEVLGEAPDLAVYGRYAALWACRNDVVYVQDDDCIIPVADVLALYEPGLIAANMPESRWADYPDSCLVGWGSVFDRDLAPDAFGRFSRLEAMDGWGTGDALLLALALHPSPFIRTCDVVFTTLTPHRKADLGFRHLPWAEDPKRAMFLKPGHKPDRDRMLELSRQVRDAEVHRAGLANGS